jgi:hypothetical protein
MAIIDEVNTIEATRQALLDFDGVSWSKDHEQRIGELEGKLIRAFNYIADLERRLGQRVEQLEDWKRVQRDSAK